MPLPQPLVKKIKTLWIHLENEKDQYNDILNAKLMAGTLNDELANASFAAKERFLERTAALYTSLDESMNYISLQQDARVFSDIYYSDFFSENVSNLALEIVEENKKLTPFLEESSESSDENNVDVNDKINIFKTAVLYFYAELIESDKDEKRKFASSCWEYVKRLDDPTDDEVYKEISINLNFSEYIRDHASLIALLIQQSHTDNNEDPHTSDSDHMNNHNNNQQNEKRKFSIYQPNSKNSALNKSTLENEDTPTKKATPYTKSSRELLDDLGVVQAMPTSFALPTDSAPVKKQEKKPEIEEKTEEENPSTESYNTPQIRQ